MARNCDGDRICAENIDSKLLCGESKIATFQQQNGGVEAYLHKDLMAAEKTISLIRRAQAELGAHICLAHDEHWMITQEDPVLLSLLSESKKGDWLQRVIQQKQP